MTTMPKVNAAAPGESPSVNGQANAHTDIPEKELEPDALEEALENGPKGITRTRFLNLNKKPETFVRA